MKGFLLKITGIVLFSFVVLSCDSLFEEKLNNLLGTSEEKLEDMTFSGTETTSTSDFGTITTKRVFNMYANGTGNVTTTTTIGSSTEPMITARNFNWDSMTIGTIKYTDISYSDYYKINGKNIYFYTDSSRTKYSFTIINGTLKTYS